jgi:hypothetical protein
MKGEGIAAGDASCCAAVGDPACCCEPPAVSVVTRAARDVTRFVSRPVLCRGVSLLETTVFPGRGSATAAIGTSGATAEGCVCGVSGCAAGGGALAGVVVVSAMQPSVQPAESRPGCVVACYNTAHRTRLAVGCIHNGWRQSRVRRCQGKCRNGPEVGPSPQVRHPSPKAHTAGACATLSATALRGVCRSPR